MPNEDMRSRRICSIKATEHNAARARTLACTSTLTGAVLSPVSVEQAPRRREAVAVSGSGRGAGDGRGEVRPGHIGGVVHVQVVEEACGRSGDGGCAARCEVECAADTTLRLQASLGVSEVVGRGVLRPFRAGEPCSGQQRAQPDANRALVKGTGKFPHGNITRASAGAEFYVRGGAFHIVLTLLRQ